MSLLKISLVLEITDERTALRLSCNQGTLHHITDRVFSHGSVADEVVAFVYQYLDRDTARELVKYVHKAADLQQERVNRSANVLNNAIGRERQLRNVDVPPDD